MTDYPIVHHSSNALGQPFAEQVLADVLNAGIQLWVERGELRFRGPKGALTPALQAQVRECKPQFIALLGEGRRYALASGGQKRLWFLEQLEPGRSAYNLPAIYHLRGALNVAVLEQSLNAIIWRHEVLRTTFATFNGQPFQVISYDWPERIATIDLTDLPEAERESAANNLCNDAIHTPFDLVHGPLARFNLIRLAADHHILLMTLHHAIFDEWSIGVFNDELSALYCALLECDELELPELSLQYADFAQWQNEFSASAAMTAQMGYWTQKLAQPPMVELPADRSRPAVRSFRGAHLDFTLPHALSRPLVDLSRAESATLFMTLLAGFKVLLFRFTGQTDLVVGSPIANRNYAAIEELIGFFVNTLALRTDLSGELTFREALSRVRETTLGAYANQDVPFDRLVEALHIERDPSYSPLFQIMFSLQNAGGDALSLPDLEISNAYLESDTAKFDLLVSISETDHGLDCTWEFSTDLFDAATITRMARHFETLLAGIAANPDQRIDALPLLTEAERHQILVEWNQTAPTYSVDRALHQRFEDQVDRTPDALAVMDDRASLSYRELDQRANQLAHHLIGLGVKPETLVGVCMDRSVEMVVALMGVLKAGGAYIPLDPAYPADRLAFMIRDYAQAAHGTPILITQPHLSNQLASHEAQIVTLDASLVLPDARPAVNVSLDAPAYMIYTSGSTGKPKGVLIPHRAIANHMQWMQIEFPLDASDRVLQKTPFSFDASVWEFYAPLLAGAALVMARPGGHQDIPYLIRTIKTQHITTLQLVPSLLHLMVEDDDFAMCHSLKRVFAGGEALSPELVARFHERHAACLINLYGPTETTIDATYHECVRGAAYRSVPIGRPISGVRAYILDAAAQPVPIGVAGELCIGGAGVASGYLNRAELTAEKFIADRYSDNPAAQLYRTGDLTRWLPDGSIEYLGRCDHQVKLRGFRIELGEIESLLARHPDVQETAVIVREDQRGDQRLVAYVVANEARIDAAMLRVFLSTELPEYMIPSAFVPLDRLPQMPNGKLDRKALPAPQQAPRTDMQTAPRSEVERTIAGVWQELLHIERVGVNQNFFELGGHSLLLIQVHARLRKALKAELSVVDLFKYPTIETLARHLTPQTASAAPAERSHIQDRARMQQEAIRRQQELAKQRRQVHGSSN